MGWITTKDGKHILVGEEGNAPNRPAGKKAGPRVPEAKPSDKAARAKASHKPSDKAKQDWAEKNEHEVAAKLNAKKSGNNLAMDHTIEHKGRTHGIELKTLLDNSNDKITMHPPSRQRKEDWGQTNRASLHTVVLDDRNKFAGGKNSAQYSGHRIYYRSGVGAYRLSGMEKVKNFDELRKKITGG